MGLSLCYSNFEISLLFWKITIRRTYSGPHKTVDEEDDQFLLSMRTIVPVEVNISIN